MRTKQGKPDKCKYCDSTRIIPGVNGSPSDNEIYTLKLQDKIALIGCFEIIKGCAIWACADCGEWVQDEAYLYDESNSELIQAYEDAVKNAVDNLEVLSETEMRKLIGFRFLRSYSREYLDDRIFELVKTTESFLIKTADGTKHEFVSNSLIPIDYFGMMDDYLGEEGTIEFAVWINKKELEAVATRVASGKIQVKQKDIASSEGQSP
ncbi:hypothetical protein [Gimesia sp.]|uniref:hypothetical protein n=1 Tax=Gimesia sp. TaxID=2024833 RepID=UPI003A926E63